jgi:hypothetical protein
MRKIFTAENLAILPVGGMLPHRPVFVPVAVHRPMLFSQTFGQPLENRPVIYCKPSKSLRMPPGSSPAKLLLVPRVA